MNLYIDLKTSSGDNARSLSGQVDFELRSFPDFAEEADEATVSANYCQDDAQPQSSPFSLLFRREERVEDARDDFGRNAGAGVGNSDADIPLMRSAKRQPSFLFDQVAVSSPDHQL